MFLNGNNYIAPCIMRYLNDAECSINSTRLQFPIWQYWQFTHVVRYSTAIHDSKSDV